MTSLAVFLGSSPGTDPALRRLAREVGDGLARRGIRLVYGGGGRGLMDDVAGGALAAGGEVVGVIPREMVTREWGRDDLTEVHVVDSMHERKALMAQRADAFLALPGGLGTLEEVFEVWTWRAIGFHDKPVGFLDAGGFWTPLLDAMDGLVAAGFLTRATLDDLVVADTLEAALAGLESRLAPGDDGGLRPGT
ncbi:TIGR00730 family Rossman fold protein [Phycicoccus sp. CMS6Z-2]|nr:TIGR00730 family Rossman fold protein [Phycicoccus flavus]